MAKKKGPTLDEAVADEILAEAADPEIQDEAEKARNVLDLKSSSVLLKHYNLDKTGKFTDDLDIDELAERFADDDYKLNPETADLLNHALVADALERNVENIAKKYKEALADYRTEKNVKKKAELEKELKMYRSLGQQIGLDERHLERMKKNGYKPNELNLFYKRVDEGISKSNIDALLQQIPEEQAKDMAADLADIYGFNKHAVTFDANLARDALRVHETYRMDIHRERKFHKHMQDTLLYEGVDKPKFKKREAA